MFTKSFSFLSLILAAHVLVILASVNSFNPLSLAGCLLMSATLSGLLLSLLNTSWFFYFLILIFLGGVMVVVLFMCSICTNKKFLKRQEGAGLLSVTVVTPVIFYLTKPSLFSLNFSSNSLMVSLFLKENSSVLVVLLSSLLVCMICVIFTSKLDSGPLIKNF